MTSAHSSGRHALPLLHAAKAKDSDHDGSESESESESSSKVTSYTTGWYPQLVVPLWGLYVSNQWTRNSISGLVNFDTSTTTGGATAFTAMNVDLHFDESQYAILASVAFTSLFAVFSVLAGSIIDGADDANRAAKRYSVLAAGAWSLAGLGVALADRYENVLICRVLMGVACAFTTPAAYSWINRVVDDGKKSTATSIYGTGVALGSALSSITLILDERLGWRNTLQLIAAVGGSMAAIAAVSLPEPSSSSEKGATPSLAATSASPVSPSLSAAPKATSLSSGGLATLYAGIQTSLATERAVWIYMASFFRFSAGLSIGVWSAPFFRSAMDNNVNLVDSYALSQGFISALGASLSGIIGGTIADRIVVVTAVGSAADSTPTKGGSGGNSSTATSTTGTVQNRLWVPVVGSLLAAPAWYMAVHTASPESFGTSMTWLAVEYFVAECWFGPTISVLQATVETARGTAQGLFTMTGAFANLAPTAIGIAVASSSSSLSSSSDLLGGQGTELELLDLLSNGVCVAYILSSLCFVMAIRSPTPGK